MARILICDDDSSVLVTLRILLQSFGYDVLESSQPSEALFLLGKQNVDLVMLDMNYAQDTTSGKEGLTLLGQIRERESNLPIIVMTGWATIDLAVAAMQRGANDFIQKPWDNDRLQRIIQTQLALKDSIAKANRLSHENNLLQQALNAEQDQGFVAESASMQALMGRLAQVANTDSNILLTGENGVGKSYLAQWLHQQSSRQRHSFIAVNMGAIPETLFESELFGHVKGAFTDAKSTRIGRFELAHQGTLFLDEIGNLPLPQQAKLLRVLENQSFEKVGSSKTQTTDVRLICATNADLKGMAQQQQFRMDLLYRINTIELRVPALRERKQDISPLAQNLLNKFCHKYKKQTLALSETALQCLQDYSWPGNLRELSHVMERAVLFTGSGTVSANDLMLPEETQPEQQEQPASDQLASMAELEQQILQQRLQHFDGNANQAAASLGLSRSAFYRRLEKYKH